MDRFESKRIASLYLPKRGETYARYSEMTIKEAQCQIDNWIKTHEVGYFSVLFNMAILTEEVGELARNIVRTYGDQSLKNTDLKNHLADEMGDVLWVLLCLAKKTSPISSAR